MAFLIIDNKERDREDGFRRSEMHRSMRSGRRSYDGVRMGDYRHDKDYDDGYRRGYEHGYKDHEQDCWDEEDYRRSRDSRGRYA